MINLDDTIIVKLDEKHFRTKYRCSCDICGEDRGYLSKQNALKSICFKCSRKTCFTSETKEKMSLAKRGKKPHNKNKSGVSQETAIKMAKSARNRDPNSRDRSSKKIETRIKISNKITGRKEFLGFKNTRRYRDIKYKIICTLRSRLSCAVRNGTKAGSAVKDLGCSIEEFKRHLESQFEENMSWSNYGRGVNKWNIDHIIPLSSFDLSNREELLKACNFKNLKPVWSSENSEKSNIKIPNRDLTGKTILIISGPSGSGKTTLCNMLNKTFYKYDTHRYGLLDCEFDDMSIVETPVRVSFFKKAFKQMGANVVCVYLKIDKEDILKNIQKRGGRYKSLDTRLKRYSYLETNNFFNHVGDFEQSLSFINSLIK